MQLLRPRPRFVPSAVASTCGILFVLHTGVQWEHLPQGDRLLFGSGAGRTTPIRTARINAIEQHQRVTQPQTLEAPCICTTPATPRTLTPPAGETSHMRERCVSGRCGTTRRAMDRHSRCTCPDQAVPDAEPASGTTQQALARTFNPLVVGSSPTGPTAGRRGVCPLTCYAAPESASVGSGAVAFSGRVGWGDPSLWVTFGRPALGLHREHPEKSRMAGG